MIKRLSAIFVCLMLCMIAVQVYAQCPVQMQYKFVPNQLLRYKLDMNMETTMQGMPGMQNQRGSIPVTMSAVMRQRVKKVLPSGDAEIAIAFESMKMSVMGNPLPSDVDKMPVMTITMSPAGIVKKIQGMEKMGNGMDSAQFQNLGNFVTGTALPLTPVKVGDRWAQDVKLPSVGAFRIQSELSAVDNGKASIKQNTSGDINSSTAVPGNAPVNSKGNINMDSTVQFSTSQGYVLRSQGKGNVQMSIGLPNGQSMTTNTKMDMVMALIEGN